MVRVLVSDKLAEEGLDILRSTEGVEVDVKTKIDPSELAEIIGEYDGLIVRSGTKVTADVLESSGKLRAIARAGVGVDNVDVPTATRKGIVVMNTPDGNTISTAEQTLALLFAVARHTVNACSSLRDGKWDKSKFVGNQLAGKTLGVVGLGRVGKAVAQRALGLEMKVIGFDPYFAGSDSGLKGQLELVDNVDDLCRESDYITVHTPLTEQTRDLIGPEQFDLMKKTTAVLNCARGGIINEQALYDALTEGKIAAAGLDVYTREPPADRKLMELSNVVCTPHLGASTAEAQTQVAVDAANQMVKALTTGEIVNAINAPGFDALLAKVLKPYASLAGRMGRILASITPGRIRKVKIVYSGEIADMDSSPVSISLLVGLLQSQTEYPINSVNVNLHVKDLGIDVEDVKTTATGDFTTLIQATLETDKDSHSITGTVFSNSLPRIVAIDDYGMELEPQGNMVISFNDDKPGVIGGVGTLFGKHEINIGSLTFGRKVENQRAVLTLTLDALPSKELLDEMAALPFMETVNFIELPPLEEPKRPATSSATKK